MAKIIAVANVKGGVGKTTTTVNLAAAFAERGCRVLAIDLDPQGSLTLSFGYQPDDQMHTVVELLDAKELNRSLILQTQEDVQIIAANQELRTFERELETTPNRIFALKHALKPLALKYDYILLDCPANAGPLTGAALAAADKVVIPMTPDYLSFQVSRSLFRIIKELQKRINPNLKVAGIYLTMYDGRTRHARDIMQGLHDTYGAEMPLFSAVVRQSVRLKEAPMVGKSIIRYEPQSQAALAYRVIAQEIEEGIGSKLKATPRAASKTVKAARPETKAKPKSTSRSGLPAAARAPKVDHRAATAFQSAVAAPAFEQVSTKQNTKDTREAAPQVARSFRPATPPPAAARAPAIPPAPPMARMVSTSHAHPADPSSGNKQAPAAPSSQPKQVDEPVRTMSLSASRDDLQQEAGRLIEKATNAVQGGDMNKGHSLFRQAIVLNPQDVRAWIGCARTSDNLPERISFAKQALKLDPANPDARDLILLTSTFMRMSVKDRWASGPGKLASVSVGVLMMLIVVALLVASQLIH